MCGGVFWLMWYVSVDVKSHGVRCTVILLLISVYITICHVPVKGGYASCCLVLKWSEKTACVIVQKDVVCECGCESTWS